MSDGWLSASGHSLEFVGVSAAQARTSLRWSRSKEVNYDFPPPPCAALTRTTATLVEPAVMPTSRSRRRRRQLWQPILRLSSQACVGSLPFTPDEAVIYAAREEFQPLRSIGIMSMQRIYNYGSSLQAYGLKRLIEGVADDVTRLVRRLPPGRNPGHGNGVKCAPTSPLKRAVSKAMEYNEVPARLRDKLRFFNHKRSYGQAQLPAARHPAEPEPRSRSRSAGDRQRRGLQLRPVQHQRRLFPRPVRARLAGAAGDLVRGLLRQHDAGEDRGLRHPRRPAERLRDFAAISVRDRNSAQIIEALTGQQPVSTWIRRWPTTTWGWSRGSRPARQHDGKYLIVYGYSGRLGRPREPAARALRPGHRDEDL